MLMQRHAETLPEPAERIDRRHTMHEPSAEFGRRPDQSLIDRPQAPLDGVSPVRRAVNQAVVQTLDGGWAFVVRHWLLLANLGFGLLLAGALAVAYLRAIGLSWLAEPLATAYLLICPQRPDHSYFPFGQPMALEQRMVAMVAAQILGGLAFGPLRRRLRPLDWPTLVLFAMPLALDGFSQMFGWRDSDWLTRTWTGGLFNLGVVLFAYPRLDVARRRALTAWSGGRHGQR